MAQLKAKRVKVGAARKDAKVAIIRLMWIGVQRTQRETARNLISMNILTDAQIAQTSGLSEAEVQALRSETTH
jgi:hypothetical protein